MQHDPDVYARLGALEERMAAIEARDRRRPPDPDEDAKLFGIIAGHFGSSVFTAIDLVRLPEITSTVRALGARLRRLKGSSLAGYRLQCIKRSDAGRLWSLTVTTDIHGLANDNGRTQS